MIFTHSWNISNYDVNSLEMPHWLIYFKMPTHLLLLIILYCVRWTQKNGFQWRWWHRHERSTGRCYFNHKTNNQINLFLHLKKKKLNPDICKSWFFVVLFDAGGWTFLCCVLSDRQKARERERGTDRNTGKARVFWDKPIDSGLVSLGHASDSTKVFCLADYGFGHHG